MPFFGIPIRNGLPIGLGSVAGFGVAPEFSPADLFLGGVNGAWYDPSDSLTLFSDTAGTTPCAAPGAGAQVVVGLMLDKSQNGVGTNGAKRLNLLTYSEQFDNAYWLNYQIRAWGSGSVANATTAPDGTTTADLAVENTANDAHVPFFRGSAASAGSYTFSIYAKAYAGSLATRYLALRMFVNVNNFLYYTFDLASASFDAKAGSASTFTNISASSTDVGSGWRRLSLSFTCAGTLDPVGTQISNVASPTLVQLGTLGTVSYTGDNTSGIYIWGADLRLTSEASTAPTYQPITSSWYATEAGNHAISYNSTTARPELSARVNLLTYSEQFDNAAWTKTNLNTTGTPAWVNVAVAPDGTTTADKLIESTATAVHLSTQQISFAANTAATVSVYAKASERSRVVLANSDTTTGLNGVYAVFNLITGNIDVAATTYGSGFSAASAAIQSVGNGWYRCSITATFTGTTRAISVNIDKGTSGPLDQSYTGDGTSGLFAWGAQLIATNAFPANTYQRIADQYTYDNSASFPRYLRFDGVDDGMSTPANLNLSSTDKATVFAGVRRAVASSYPVICEFSADWNTNNYCFFFGGDDTPLNRWFMGLKGTSLGYYSPQTYTPPISNVLTAQYNLAGANLAAQIVPRVNGIVEQENPVGSSGTPANFGTYPLFIGSRNNSSFWFNGNIYSLIVRGAATDASTISATETWVAGKTGVQL